MTSKEIIHFLQGIPGFEEYLDYNLVIDTEAPLAQLLARDDENVGFILVRPESFFNNYIELIENEINFNDLSLQNPIEIWAILTLNQKNIENSTVNLKAPILISEKDKNGIQVISTNENLLTRQPLFSKIVHENQKEGAVG